MKRRKHHSTLLTGSILMLAVATFNAEQAAAAELSTADSPEKPIIYETTSETTQNKTEIKTSESNKIEAKAIYTGLADPHTAEIEVNGEAICFQLKEGIMEKVEAWDAETSVEITYSIKTFAGMPDVKQFILHNINQVK
ncbi:hypothetical protein QPK24_18515 [Paenibacillus polygoni]|uniref:Uncharacterized protein n=1 Tax=Paenibacillus polygoni TaxID=3050112 RepID=A0ABY8WYU1_9BACL|nr:hypothetical protein [Paenibacillus polygoni]WIV18367.1 hypothetical protein QPK24_18515 [Paenibacillus polygoni]